MILNEVGGNVRVADDGNPYNDIISDDLMLPFANQDIISDDLTLPFANQDNQFY